MIKKYLSSNETLTYINQIPQFISNYNNRIHLTLNNKFINIFKIKKPVLVVNFLMINLFLIENKFEI
jgi:hypothetical protein